MISTVIFDMDGVIINSEPIHQQVEKDFFEELGLNLTYEERMKFVGTSAKNMWQEIVERFNLNHKVEYLVAEKRMRYFNLLDSEGATLPIPHSRELILDLHNEGFKLVLASSASRPNIDKVMNLFELNQYFPIQVSGEDLPRSKPHPDIFLTAARLIDSIPLECLVIEDSRNGVLAAKAAGMKCVGYRNPDSGVQDLSPADLIIDSLNQLNTEILRSWI